MNYRPVSADTVLPAGEHWFHVFIDWSRFERNARLVLAKPTSVAGCERQLSQSWDAGVTITEEAS
jgi:hypothetical protein